MVTLDPDTLRQIFGWDIDKILTKMATLTANIDVSGSVTYAHSQTPAFEKMFSATKKDHAPRKKRWTSGMFQMRKDFGRHRHYYRVT